MTMSKINLEAQIGGRENILEEISEALTAS